MQPGDTGSPGPVDAATEGLSTAKDKAGDVLQGIFDGLPWEMSADSIVDAVTGTVLPATLDAVGVMA